MIAVRTSKYNYINYSYIFVDTKTNGAFLIDPTWEIDKILEPLQKLKVHPAAIALTHSHFDHVYLADKLARMFKINVYMSQAEVSFSGFCCNNLITIKDMDKIEIGNSKLLCLLTPGHSPGSMCYIVNDNIFTGDTLFNEGCGTCKMGGGSAEQMYDSLQRLKWFLPTYMKVYPGHSYGIEPGQTMDFVIQNNIYLQINNRDEFIGFRMRKNQKGNFDFK